MQKEKLPCSVKNPKGIPYGKTSFYVVGNKGFCEQHRQKARDAAKPVDKDLASSRRLQYVLTHHLFAR